jgi:hypothetical protein
MFEELVSVNVMLIVLLFVFVTIFAVNILASITTTVLSLIICLRKLHKLSVRAGLQSLQSSKDS